MSTRKKGISQQQINRIRELSKQGKNTNQVQRTLSKEGIGLRRQAMLNYVREARNRPVKANTQIYTPIKFRRTFTPYGKSVAVYGTVNGRPKRVQMSGNGKPLYHAMKLVAKHPPAKKLKFLSISANELLRDPKKYLDLEREWDEHPKVKS
jgi:hypothetical protein